MAPLVTLLTDFGNVDSYVAEVKAVLLTGLPDVRLVDISHAVPVHNIRHGAFQLLRAYRHFPKGTCHLAVVDPGVGTPRRALYVRSKDYHFIGPDNGLLRWALEDCEIRDGAPVEAYEISVPLNTEPTFHGRDVLAPFAVRVLGNAEPPALEPVRHLQGAGFPAAKSAKGGIQAEVVAIDHFGNLILSAPHAGDDRRVARWGRRKIETFAGYDALPPRGAGLIRGSNGFWEISCHGASAAKRLRGTVGRSVLLERPAKTKRSR